MNKSMLSASLVALALAAPLAHAFEAGDILLRAGAITVNPEADSSSVKVDQGPLAGADLGGKATMSSDTQLGLNFAYMLTNHLGIELLAATPFEHDVKLKGTALSAANGKLGTLKHLPPTLSLVYYPLDPKSAFQPYVGGGINYTYIYDEHVGSQAQCRRLQQLQGGKLLGSGVAGRCRLHADRQHHDQRPGALHRHRYPRDRREQRRSHQAPGHGWTSMSTRSSTWWVWVTSSKENVHVVVNEAWWRADLKMTATAAQSNGRCGDPTAPSPQELHKLK